MAVTFLPDHPGRLIAAAIAALLIAALAWRLRALSGDGAVAATVTGGLIVGAGGWWMGAILVVFFVTSTALSRWRRVRSSAMRQARGNRRDAVQVIANGGVPVVLSVIGWITETSAWQAGAVAAIAAATADTWATESGRLSQRAPRSLITFRTVPVGTSGAISVPGTLASIAGAAAIGALATFGEASAWLGSPFGAWPLLAMVIIAGTAGSLLDSLLGATLQERRRCLHCGATTESQTHACGGDTVVTGGIAGLDNDMVNFLSVGVVAVMVTVLGYVAA